MRHDIKNLFSLKRFNYCKNVIALFSVVLSFLILEIARESDKTQWGFIGSVSTLIVTWKTSSIGRSGLLMGVVPVPVKMDSSGTFERIHGHRKPRGTFGKFRLIKVTLVTLQSQFSEILFQCSGSPGDPILILISPK